MSFKQECRNTIPHLSDQIPFQSGQVRNLYLLVLGQVKRNLIHYLSLLNIMNSHNERKHLLSHLNLNISLNENSVTPDQLQETKLFQYCTCPAGQVTYNFPSSCQHMHLSFKTVCNKEHKGVT